jgi:superfamily II DNA or RNA helicase
MNTLIRMTHRFDWIAVDEGLTRDLLIAAYKSRQQLDQLAAIKKLSKEALASQAAKVFKSISKDSRHFDAAIEVLVKKWLPGAPAKIIESLATRVKAHVRGTVVLRNKVERVRFLQDRQLDNNFKTNVFKAFKDDHKVTKAEPRKPPVLRDKVLPVKLNGVGEAVPFPPYPHQTKAHQSLDRLLKTKKRPAGVLVLPTGAGKTDTMATWLLSRMHKDPALRVLWLAHQQQLLDQSMRRFEARARSLPENFERTGRVVHGDAADISVIANAETDVAAVTIQSLAINFSKGRNKQRFLQHFLKRPTIVVVDEAHHAAAPTYDEVLELIAANPNTKAIVGLTATPWPTSYRARAVFKRRFPTEIVHVTVEELISKGILARPVLQTIATGQQIRLDPREARVAEATDLPSSALKLLETSHRNRVIVQTYASRRDDWGKTLVFANSIEHADELGKQLGAYAPTRVLHSRIDQTSGEILDWFKRSKAACVLVSVGMLTEGVDLPDARTAFLARPTTSRILMRQMIGRVLRGPQAGGKSEANLVFFRDVWTNFSSVLEPPEVITVPKETRADGIHGEVLLPPVVDDTGKEIEADILASIRRAIESLAKEDSRVPIDPLLIPSRLIGYYRVDDQVIPVFEHQKAGYDALLELASGPDGMRGTPALSLFDDSHPPYPSPRALQAFIDYVREFEELPLFFELDSQLGPDLVAAKVLKAGAIKDEKREKIIRECFESSANRVAYPSFERFEEAVEQRIRQLRRIRSGERPRFEPESQLEQGNRRRTLPRFARDLEPIRQRALEGAREILPKHLGDLLEEFAPPVEWTKRAAKSTWGHWSLQLQGKRRGEQVIRVNRLLRTTSDAASDELIAYLIYHEMLHSLLPGQGHDAEFRELESLWVSSAELDAEFETMHERWNLDPNRYDD